MIFYDKQDCRFTATTDEWTDLMIRRFACINIHLPGGEPRTIGMIRIKDTLYAEKAADILTKVQMIC